ncbi:MAG: hypothetical protein J6S49_02170 [Erysipelotrichaceae bacterium]|nr:hypothetical protein [Erysipelotrichaceae bacterium]
MEEKKEVKLVPAICSQCGATLEVDPSQEAAVCRFCNTPFVIEKAINNYNVKYANIEHADNVNIDLSGTVKEVLNFAGKQIAESRAERKEARKIQKEEDKQFMITFFKYFFIFAAVVMVLWFIVINI